MSAILNKSFPGLRSQTKFGSGSEDHKYSAPGSGSDLWTAAKLFDKISKKHVFSEKKNGENKKPQLRSQNLSLEGKNFLLRSWGSLLSLKKNVFFMKNKFFSEKTRFFGNIAKRLRSHSPEVGAWSGAFLIPGTKAKFVWLRSSNEKIKATSEQCSLKLNWCHSLVVMFMIKYDC